LLQGYNKKPKLIVGKLPEKGNESKIKWTFADSDTTDELEQTAQVDVLKFKPEYENKNFPSATFEAILVHPKEKNDVLVVFPHGGPHSAYSCEFNYHIVILSSMGYSTLMINYRGSNGYGQDNVDSLPGDIGFQDVRDCQVSFHLI